MPRPKVPHCRQCEKFMVFGPVNYYSVRNLGYKCLDCDKWLTYQEIKTSPVWCPKRKIPFSADKGI